MSENADYRAKRNEDQDSVKSPVDFAHAKSKQDLWDLDDDIFKPLLERVQEERKAEQAERAQEDPGFPELSLSSSFQSERLPSSQPAQNPVRKPAQAPNVPMPMASAVIKSPVRQMPRVIWQPHYSLFKKIKKTIQQLSDRTHTILGGVMIFSAWMLATLFTASMLGAEAFQFDPLKIENWRMVKNLYNSGSTLQWPFVTYCFAMFVFAPLFGLMASVKGAKELRPMISAIVRPFAVILRSILHIPLLLVGGRKKSAPVIEPISMPRYAKQQYKGANFQMDQDDAEEAPVGGGGIGGGSGGGHGKPSWQGGPANTQAFPRAEQGRR